MYIKETGEACFYPPLFFKGHKSSLSSPESQRQGSLIVQAPTKERFAGQDKPAGGPSAPSNACPKCALQT